MAVDRVEQQLRSVARALETAGISYAVVGGNAVAAWVATVDPDATRATKDVDILVRREDLAGITQALRPLNLIPAEVLGVHMFVDRDRPSPKSGVHLVIAGELIRPHYSQPAPDPGQSEGVPHGFSVIELQLLVEMKLQSFRDVDRTHIRDLISVGLVDESWIERLPEDLANRLGEILDRPE